VAAASSKNIAMGSTLSRGVLRVGADGSTEALGSAATAAALSTVSVGGPAARSVDPVTGAVRAADAGAVVGQAATGAGAGLELASWLPGEHSGRTWAGPVDLGDGRRAEVTAHDVAETWHTGTGALRPGSADQYAGVAVVTVPLSTLRSTVTTAPRPGSDERDHQDRVRGGGR